MATVSINLCTTTARMQQQPVVDDVPVDSEVLTSSGASQQGTVVAATQTADIFWAVASVGGAIWVKFGTNPTVSAGDGFLVGDGQTIWLRATPGNKPAIIDA